MAEGDERFVAVAAEARLRNVGDKLKFVGQRRREPMTEPKSSRPHMPGYGILDADKGKGLLPWSWATERLGDAHTYWVATVRPDGAPHVMPVWGVWLDDKFCFSTGANSRKARNLAAHPQCVICCEASEAQIIAEGVAEVIIDSELNRRFAEAYGPKYAWDMEGFSEPVYAVRPNVVFGFTPAADEFASTATRWTFDREQHEGPLE
jgi:nitroimidazol reductase NimA-like FMN-containing flavoprotein (pyridoxamine 5'-phosphate oxidase superfamily)